MRKIKLLNGYKIIYMPEHPRAMNNDSHRGWVYEHIVECEEANMHILQPHEEVHHLDLNCLNNNPENLIYLDASQHTKLHNHLKFGHIRNTNNLEDPTRYCSNPECDKIVKNPKNLFCSNVCRIKSDRSKRNIIKPSKEVLEQQIDEINNFAELGRMYGIGANSVRKWAKSYGLRYHTRKAESA